MEITVRESAKDFIRQKGGTCYLDDAHTAVSCCLHITFAPEVRLGMPRNKQEFRVEEFDGLTLYVPKNFVSPFPLTIVVSKFFWYSHLAIEGWKLV